MLNIRELLTLVIIRYIVTHTSVITRVYVTHIGLLRAQLPKHHSNSSVCLCVIGADKHEYCSGYLDEHGLWNNGFYCPRWGGPEDLYCCGDNYSFYCCEEPPPATTEPPEIVS